MDESNTFDLKEFNLEFASNIESNIYGKKERQLEEKYSLELNDEQNRKWKVPLYSELNMSNIYDRIFAALVDVVADLVQPGGRSWFDAFWIQDRPFYLGVFLLIISLLLKCIYVIYIMM